jgi:hypothetical protein
MLEQEVVLILLVVEVVVDNHNLLPVLVVMKVEEVVPVL